MSEQGNTAAAPDKAVDEMKEKFDKKGKLVALANDDQELFVKVMGEIANVADWTNGADDKVFTGLALGRADNGRVVLIPLASEEAVFSDPVVRKALLKIYYNKQVNAAMELDAVAADFLTVAGNYKQKFDVDAFKEIARPFVKVLRAQGLSGITVPSLRQAFASQAFAQGQFPRTTADQWKTLINMAKALSAKQGNDVSIFEHWEATRDVQTADVGVLNLDFAKFGEIEDATDDSEGETKPTA